MFDSWFYCLFSDVYSCLLFYPRNFYDNPRKTLKLSMKRYIRRFPGHGPCRTVCYSLFQIFFVLIELYTVCSSKNPDKNLAQNLIKNLAKNLVKNLVNNLAKNRVPNLINTSGRSISGIVLIVYTQ